MVGSAGLKLLTQVPGLGQCLAAEGQRVASGLWGQGTGEGQTVVDLMYVGFGGGS